MGARPPSPAATGVPLKEQQVKRPERAEQAPLPLSSYVIKVPQNGGQAFEVVFKAFDPRWGGWKVPTACVKQPPPLGHRAAVASVICLTEEPGHSSDLSTRSTILALPRVYGGRHYGKLEGCAKH